MTEKKWTLLLLGDNPQGIKQVSVSRRFLRVAGGSLAAFAVVVLGLSALLVINGTSHFRAQHLARENALLTQELQRFQTRVDGLEQTLVTLGEEDSRIRLLAGLLIIHVYCHSK